MEEIWKPIVGWENTYKISNLGKVKRIARNRKNTRPNLSKIIQEKILVPYLGKGYLIVSLTNFPIIKRARIHRLVAEHFILKVGGKEYVNHIDGNKLNNCASNLEWCTAKENIKHSWEIGLRNHLRKH